MSSDFDKRIKALKTAYSEQLKAKRIFVTAWAKISEEKIRPVLRIAKDNFYGDNISLDTEKENEQLNLTIRRIPVGKLIPKLSYRPYWREEVVVVTVDDGDGREEERIPLEDITSDLIESHVENFLKNALRLKV